jgi:hypothetical protein
MPKDKDRSAVSVSSDQRRGVLVLHLSFASSVLIGRAPVNISDALVAEYESRRKEIGDVPMSCIVEMMTPIGGSPVVHALIDLWRQVQRDPSSKLVCVNFPDRYSSSLPALGMDKVEGFYQARTMADAMLFFQELPGPHA